MPENVSISLVGPDQRLALGAANRAQAALTALQPIITDIAGPGTLAKISAALTAGTIQTVAGSIAAVGTVSASIANVNTVGGSIANVNIAAGGIANINTVAADLNLGASSLIRQVPGLAANVVAATSGLIASISTTTQQAAGVQAPVVATSTGANGRVWALNVPMAYAAALATATFYANVAGSYYLWRFSIVNSTWVAQVLKGPFAVTAVGIKSLTTADFGDFEFNAGDYLAFSGPNGGIGFVAGYSAGYANLSNPGGPGNATLYSLGSDYILQAGFTLAPKTTQAVTAVSVAAGQAMLQSEISAIGTVQTSQRNAQATADSTNRMVDRVSTVSGKREIASAYIRKINGWRPEAGYLGTSRGPLSLAELFSSVAFLLNFGQSRAEGNAQSVIATTQRIGKAIGYANQTASITQNYPLTGASPVSQGSDFPGLGTIEFLYELLLKEHGIGSSDIGMVPAVVNNAQGSHAITTLTKGNAIYSDCIAAMTYAAQTDAPAMGLRSRFLGTFWSQGEADTTHSGGSYAYYYSALAQLANYIKADALALCPGQTFTPFLVACGVDTYGPGNDRFGVTRAILQLAIDYFSGASPAPILYSTPTYFMDMRADAGSGTHLISRDAKWLGAYAALALKRTLIDGIPWKPMVPQRVSVENGSIFVDIQMRHPDKARLVIAETLDVNQCFDGKHVYQQPGRGFSGVDTSGNPLAFKQMPDIVGPNTIRLIPTVSPATIARIDYAQQQAVGMYPFGTASAGSSLGSGAGNFRDNYGDLVTYDGANSPASAVNRRMDNWLPTFSVLPSSSAPGFTWPAV